MSQYVNPGGANRAQNAGAQNAEKLVSGIGLYFQQDETHNRQVYVKTIMKGGSAEHDGTVRVGDLIMSVEKQNVERRSIPDIKSIIRGEIGAYVNLGFKRISDDGSETMYEVSLMRGQAEYIASKEKTRLQQMLDEFRKRLQHSEVELEALRGALVRSEKQTNKDKGEIERLTRMIDEMTTQVKEQTNIITQMQLEKDNLSEQADPTRGVKDEVSELTKLLQEAGSHLNSAKESLEKDQRKTWELEELYKKEKTARDACEVRIRKMEAEVGPRNEQERLYRDNQDQLRKKLIESRDRLAQMLSEAQGARETEIQRREQAEANDVVAEERLQAVQKQNQEIQVRVKETEKLLRGAEGQRLEVLGKHEALTSDLSRIKNQAQVREQLIVDLQSRIEEDYSRWDQAVKSAKDNRRQDEERFQDAETTLLDQLTKLKGDRAKYEQAISEVLLQHEQRRLQLVEQKEDIETSLSSQRNVSAQLRDEVAKLTSKLQQTEADVSATRTDISRIEASRRAHEQETSLSEQRRQAIETEYEMYLRKEQLRMDFVQEANQMHAQALEDLDKQIQVVGAQREETVNDKSGIDQEIKRCSEAINKFQELDRLRRQRADEFREKRYGLLEQFSELLVSQHGLRKTIEGIKKPVSVAVAFYDREIASIAESFPNAFDTDSKDHFSTATLAKDIHSSAFTMHSSPPRAAFYSSGQHPIVRSVPAEQHHGEMIHYSTVPVNGFAQAPAASRGLGEAMA